MLVAESRMVMGKAHVFHVGSLSHYTKWQGFVLFFMIEFVDFTEAIGILQVRSLRLYLFSTRIGFTPFYFPKILLLVSYEQCW